MLGGLRIGGNYAWRPVIIVLFMRLEGTNNWEGGGGFH